MKLKILWIVFLVSFFSASAQDEIFYVKDSLNAYSIENIDSVNFKLLPKNQIVLDDFSNASYWFKISKKNTDSTFIFRTSSIVIKNAIGFQDLKPIEMMVNEPYPTFTFSRKYDAFFKVECDNKVYFPVEVVEASKFNSQQNKILLFNGFYYGFSFLVLLYSFVYYYFFKDKSYLYYALFLSSITLGFVIIDGVFFIFNSQRNLVNFLIILNYVLIAFFSSKFVNSFLLLEEYYPNLKKYTYGVGTFIVVIAISFLLFDNRLLYVILSVLVFSLLFVYWFTSVILFKENIFTKILAIGFFILLFSSINTLVLTNLGISFFNTSPIAMKIGGFIQIVVIWFAQLYREKYLRDQNNSMKEEIISYSDSKKYIDDKELEVLINTLSFREKEIFNLIKEGYSNKQIAEETNVSINTIKFHIKNIYDKLQVKNRKEAINLTNTTS